MCKFDVYTPVANTTYCEFFTSVYADSQEEAEELADKALADYEAQMLKMAPDTDYSNATAALCPPDPYFGY